MVTKVHIRCAGRQGVKALALQNWKRGGALMTELVVAMGILAIGIIPLSLGFLQESKAARASYYRAVALEVIDGEMECLVGGEWKAFPKGAKPYPVRAQSATNLPAGTFKLSVVPGHLKLEWQPEQKGICGPVTREVNAK